MFKFKGTKNQQSSTEIAKSVEDFVTFTKIATLGFPHKPAALAWEPHLCFMAIGTQFGSIRIYGAPGVQFCGDLRQRLCITDLIFISKKARLICLCSDNSLHLWELNEKNDVWCLEEIKSFVLVGLMKKITAIFLNASADILYLGTMCGNIYTLNVETFEIAESVIYQDVVVQNIPDDKKLKQGAVKVISYQPTCPDCLLIGYQQGLLALWDVKKLVVISTFISSQSLESVAWQHSGTKFMSSHSDGSYVVWSTEDSSKPAEVPITPYGPFSCKSIDKILWKTVKGGDDFVIFSGGMPRSNYGDKNTLTIMCGDRHEVLDLSSKVIDFFTISDVFDESEFDNVRALILLLEEELIALDLESESWLPFKYPYLEIPHSSPITCFQYISEVHKDMWRLLKTCQIETAGSCSENEWPIKGGKVCSNDQVNNILVTGHENGCIKIWNATLTSLQLINSFNTSEIFIVVDTIEENDSIGEEWPPFRKQGNFDPLMDDPRFAIRSIVLNDVSRTLVAGGSAGQVFVLQLLDIEAEKETIVSHITIGDKGDNYSWYNSQPLIVKTGKRRYEKGFHVQCVVQISPPVPVTSLAFHAEWNLLAAGITHGFLLYDIVQKKCVLSRYTLNVSDSGSIISNVAPKTRSLKKSFRESFRKLKIRSKSLKKDRTDSISSDIPEDISRENSMKRDSFTASPDPTLASSTSADIRAFDGDSESHIDDVINSIQCLYFAQSFIVNNVITTPTLWIGTGNGTIYIYTITMPASDCRTSDAITCQLGKEVQLKHQASVLGIQIVDHRGYPLPDPTEVQSQRSKPADLCGSHRVIVCTEEQIKIFTLPSMKPFCKNKVSVVEGYHICKVGFCSFPNRTDSKTCENCVLCLSRSCGITLYSTPELRKFISFSYCSLEDNEFLPKAFLLNNGLVVCLNSMSEFEIVSLSSAITTKAACRIELPEGARKPFRPLESIVLEMQNIAPQNCQGSYHNNAAETNGEFHSFENHEQARRLSLASSSRNHEQNNEADAENISNRSREIQNHIDDLNENTTRQQLQRAPLAVIEELNSSDESHLNQSSYSSRRS